jgi:hypothetical protein
VLGAVALEAVVGLAPGRQAAAQATAGRVVLACGDDLGGLVVAVPSDGTLAGAHVGGFGAVGGGCG